jgi:predicted exporter
VTFPRKPVPILKALARAGLLVLLGLAIHETTGLRMETDITRFLPDNQERRMLALSGLVRATGFSKGMILDIRSPDQEDIEASADRAIALADLLAEDLRASGLFRSVNTGGNEAIGEDTYRLWFPRRLAFLSDDPETEIPRMFSDEGLAEAATSLRDRLTLPSGSLFGKVAPADPLLAFTAIAGRMQDEAGRLAPRLHRDHYFSRDLRHLLMMVETEAPAFDTKTQKQVLDLVRTRFATRNTEAGGGFVLAFTGLNRFVVEGESRAKADVAWVSTASTIGVALLFLFFFRRLRFLPLAFLPVGFGIVTALGAVHAVNGTIHGLTLGFGSTLIGVCIDYPVHLLNHLRAIRPPDPAARNLAWRRLLRHLVVGSVTTLAGFACMAFSSYPGIREISLFAIVGIVAAFLFTVLFLPLGAPWLGPVMGKSPANALPFLEGMSRVVRTHRRSAIAILAVAGLGALALLPTITLETDARALDQADPATLAEDAAVRQHLPTAAFPRYFLVSGATPQEALAANDTLYRALRTRQTVDPDLEFVSLHPFLPSAELQKRNLAALAAVTDAGERAIRSLEKTGFRAQAFAPFLADLDAAQGGRVDPLTFDSLAGSALADVLKGFHFDHDGRTWILTLAGPSGDLEAVDAMLPDGMDRVRIEPSALVSSLVTSSQRETVLLFLLGMVVNVILIGVYRGRFRAGCVTLGPTFLALLMILAGIALLGIPLNFLHVVGMLLILAMGMDYAVFLLGRPRPADDPEASVARTSVLLSAMTTALTFGLLATCQTAALRSIGGVVCAGILLVCCLTFLVKALAAAEHGAS